MSRYDNKCGTCSYSEYYKAYGSNEKVYCTYYGQYFWADDSCYHYSGGFVATVICDILGEEKHKDALEKIKKIRREILDWDKDYKVVMDRYDQIAPKIAKQIKQDYIKNKDKSLAVSIFNYYIEPTVQLYENKKVFESIEKYSEMVDILEACYGFESKNYKNLDTVKNIQKKKMYTQVLGRLR